MKWKKKKDSVFVRDYRVQVSLEELKEIINEAPQSDKAKGAAVKLYRSP